MSLLTRPVLPAPTTTAIVGMVGGGQLARMTHQAAIALDIDLRVMTPRSDAPAVRAGASYHAGRPDDLAALFDLARTTQVVTFDHELVPNAHVERLVAEGHAVRPGPSALRLAQDKSWARAVLDGAGYPVPAFLDVAPGDTDAIASFGRDHGWPVVVKAPRGGYDGRGVALASSPDDLGSLDLSPPGGRVLLEERVPIATELAVLVARRPDGQVVHYPVVETVQRDGICHELVMPARVPEAVALRAVEIAVSIANGIDVTGIMALELFLTTDGSLVVNELATRPHNSGHATIDATATSQFENHLRAVLDLPLGATDLLVPASATVNVLGGDRPADLAEGLARALREPGVRVHLYGKAHAPGRKLGHVTALAADPDAALASARSAARALGAR
jgi:5-(carboxyamino)imidazole ribonucleotide synthase